MRAKHSSWTIKQQGYFTKFALQKKSSFNFIKLYKYCNVRRVTARRNYLCTRLNHTSRGTRIGKCMMWEKQYGLKRLHYTAGANACSIHVPGEHAMKDLLPICCYDNFHWFRRRGYDILCLFSYVSISEVRCWCEDVKEATVMVHYKGVQ